MDLLHRHIEALIFCSPEPLKLKEIRECLKELYDADIDADNISKAIQDLTQTYKREQYSFEIISVAKGYQFVTKPAYQASISILLKQQSKKRLTTSALEVLSIIAYRQPVTKSQIEQIRGVNSDYAANKLLEKGLIEITGKSDGPGRPLLYGTSPKFMEYFHINSLKDLPELKDILLEEENKVGQDQSA